VLAPLPKKLVAIEHYRMLGKRGEPEKVRIVTALAKQETPRKCLAIHAGTLEREEEDEVFCDVCPEPKKKGTDRAYIRPSWHCLICKFNLC
jgi:hypothetical protein